ncbi:MAG: Gfo/Idh/MocA family oxidoreductase [Akkermansiaceae bacterium]|nr:Gfo/Idh/MocA family oxidoreductase [Akkermansiaceae bacterium]
MNNHFDRRKFIGTMGLAAASSVVPTLGQSANKNSKLRLLQIGVGGIGAMDRNALKKHPKVEIAGLCDINKKHLDEVARQFPKAATYADARIALTKDIDNYDGVVVCTPDHSHAVFALQAMAKDKHLFLQKPVVQQLDEIRMLKKALAAKPGLATQMGNQRSAIAGRNQAIAILKSGALGKATSAWAWTGKVAVNHYFDKPWLEKYYDAQPVPSHINWDLWKNCYAGEVPYNNDIAHRKWRTYWEFGGGQLADWCCHLLDVIFLGLDLEAPICVQTDTPRPSTPVGHSAYNQSRLTFNKTAYTKGERFIVHYNDHDIHPPCSETGLPLGTRYGSNHTIFVCENGTIVLQANGTLHIYQNGKKVDNFPLPKVASHNHWHDWVDNCFGAKNKLLGDLNIGALVTEAGLLTVKATRYPNRELIWDSKANRFKDDPPNKHILKRAEYRDGFKPPAEFA